MKIVFITPYYKPYLGGIERVIERMGRELITRGHEVHILTSKYEFPNSPSQSRVFHDEWQEYEKLSSGEHVHRLHSVPQKAPSFYQAPLVWFNPLTIRKIIKRINPDVLQLMGDRWFWGNLWSVVFSGNATVVFAVIFHELSRGRENRIVPWIIKQFLRPINWFIGFLSDNVHVVTTRESKMVQETYRIFPNKIKIIPWGVDFAEYQISERVYTKLDPIRVLAVGRISEHKGQDWLLERLDEVTTIINKPILVHLVGKDDGLGSKILDKYKNHHLLHVISTGAISDEDLEQEYKQADIFALFPEYESFGLVYIEAMAYGLPVVTHDVGPVAEVLKDSALIINCYNNAQAKVVLTKLIEDAEFREKYGKSGYEYVRSTFSWDKTVDAFLDIYTKR